MKASPDAILHHKNAPFEVLTEAGHSLIKLETFSFEEMEEWILLMEGSALTFINRAVENVVSQATLSGSILIISAISS